AELLLIGRLAMAPPQVPGARYLGFLPEAEKLAVDRRLATGPYLDRLPDLLRRDLWASLRN
ncbi:MAG: hypothetical protein ACREN5_05490, partial [Gemmatimonadales bacterium]